MLRSLSWIREGYRLFRSCTGWDRYIEMLIAIPTLGYLRSNR